MVALLVSLLFYFCLLAVRFSECIHDGTRVLNAFLRPITLNGKAEGHISEKI